MQPTANDHDLLVRLDTKLDALTLSFADVKLAVASKADAARVERLENTVESKADAARVEKLEDSVDSIKSKFFAIGGALGALQVAAELALHRFFK